MLEIYSFLRWWLCQVGHPLHGWTPPPRTLPSWSLVRLTWRRKWRRRRQGSLQCKLRSMAKLTHCKNKMVALTTNWLLRMCSGGVLYWIHMHTICYSHNKHFLGISLLTCYVSSRWCILFTIALYSNQFFVKTTILHLQCMLSFRSSDTHLHWSTNY